jgi:NDP-sugar pyrophosphorylase family protein
MALAGVETVYVAVNYLADEFERKLGDCDSNGVKIKYLRESAPLGTAGALSLLPAGLTGPVIVANGDILTTVDFARLLEFHRAQRAVLTVAGALLTTQVPYGVLRTNGHTLIGVDEKPQRRELCNAGIYVLHCDAIALLDAGEPIDMPELIDRALGKGLPAYVFPIVEKWFDVSDAAALRRILVQVATGDDE